jgi:hypothetical protein
VNDITLLKQLVTYDAASGELRKSSGKLIGKDGFCGHTPHALAFALYYGRWLGSGMVIDHINGDYDDNRICNIRECTQQQNLCNRRRGVNNCSGYKGVSWHKDMCRWQATLKVYGRQKHLGYFDDPKEAYEIYCEAAKQAHGEFFNPG